MKRLVCDARCMGTGLGTYVTNVLRSLRALKPEFSTTVITTRQYEPQVRGLCDKTIALDLPVYSAREQIQVLWAARGADLLHVMHYNAPLARTGPLVVSIHDLTHILDKTHARTLKSWIYARPMLNLVARKADHIFTLSTYSRDQIVRCLGVPPEKITITYVGVGDQFHPMSAEQNRAELLTLKVDRPYILFVGHLKPHKNVKTLLRAFAELVKHGNDADLVIVGDDRIGRPAVLAEIEALGIQARVRIFQGLEIRLLAALYGAAEVLVLPSFEEGFGLPVLEAMACGTPVACSRAASLPEVGGDAVEYFDPNSCGELVACLDRILQSPEKRQRMRELGLARARLFSWSDCAQKHYDVYRRFLS